MNLQETEDTSGVLREVHNHLARKGVAVPGHPGHMVPELPADISGIPSEALINLMAVYEGLKTHAHFLTAEADTVASAKAVQLKLARAREYMALRDAKATGRKLTNDETDALLDMNEPLALMRHALVQAEGYKTMVKAVADGFESKFNLLSRELTRRGNRGERE